MSAPSVLLLPGSYKGSLTSLEAVELLLTGFESERVVPGLDYRVITDGGEGTIEAFEQNFAGVVKVYRSTDPLGRAIDARVCWLNPRTVVIESAQVVGHSLISPASLDPWRASSRGFGLLLNQLVSEGASEVLATMGDSAVMDAGVGALASLGVLFFDRDREIFDPTLADFRDITKIVCPERPLLGGVRITVLGDTKDHLCGGNGQSAMYGRQKGLRYADQHAAERGLAHLADLVQGCTGIDVARTPMSSGSGGLAAALHAFFGAPLVHTLDYFDTRMGLTELIEQASCVITGEGYLDEQSRWGKVPFYVAERCRHQCVLLVGGCSDQGLADINSVSRSPVETFILGAPTSEVDSSTTFLSAARRIAKCLV